MHDDVRAEFERPLEIRRREGIVHHEKRAGRVRRFSRPFDVHDVQQRVRRCLDPHDPSSLVEVRGEVVELGRRQIVEDVALGLVDLRGHAVDAAVDVGDQHHPVARAQQMHDRADGA